MKELGIIKTQHQAVRKLVMEIRFDSRASYKHIERAAKKIKKRLGYPDIDCKISQIDDGISVIMTKSIIQEKPLFEELYKN